MIKYKHFLFDIWVGFFCIVVYVLGNWSVTVSNVIFMINVTAYDLYIKDYLEFCQDSYFILENQTAFIIWKKRRKKLKYKYIWSHPYRNLYSCLSIYLIINYKFLVDKNKKIELSLMYRLGAKDCCQLLLFPLSDVVSETCLYTQNLSCWSSESCF